MNDLPLLAPLIRRLAAWALGLATAASLLLTFFVALAGSSIALVAGSLFTALLAVGTLAVIFMTHTARADETPASAPRLALPNRPSKRDAPADRPVQTAAAQSPAGPPLAVPEIVAAPANGQSFAQRLAQEAMEQLAAPAAAVLVVRGRRLVAMGSAGDWALARHNEQTSEGAPAALPPGSSGPAENGDPPEFPLDDTLPQLLALYSPAMPVERWHELSDVPLALLPLAGLADRGAAVAVTLRHRRRLAGLWVLGRRAKGRRYSDEELKKFERLARDAAPALAATLANEGPKPDV